MSENQKPFKPKREAGNRSVRNESERPAWQQRVAVPKNPERAKSPLIPDEITAEELPLPVRVQLKTLTEENAERVARHLAMVGLLIDQDPELAHAHAMAAVARANRIALVHEFAGATAYATGDFALALRELQTHRRISGSNEQIAIMVDCERGLGRPDKALAEGRAVDRAKLTAETRVNLAIALSGARLDKGEKELALAELEIAELNPSKVHDYSVPLFYAYAECLKDLGRDKDAAKWASLAQRAEREFDKSDGDNLEVLEEIEIPVRRERTEGELEMLRDLEARRGAARSAGRGTDRGGRPAARGAERDGKAGESSGRTSERGSRDGADRGRSFGRAEPRGGKRMSENEQGKDEQKKRPSLDEIRKSKNTYGSNGTYGGKSTGKGNNSSGQNKGGGRGKFGGSRGR